MGESGAGRSRGALPVALRILLVAGFVIAIAATVLVVFAEDVRLLRLAAVLALWAALIAAFAVTRSRRDARAAAMRENEAQLAYQLELHREVAARREYEADLTRQVATEQSDQLDELRGQLERLTSVLASLADGEVTVSRLTLSAESRRYSAKTPVLASQHPQAVAAGGRYLEASSGAVDADMIDATSLPAGPGPTGEATGSALWSGGTRERVDAPAAAWARRHADLTREASADRERESSAGHRRGDSAVVEADPAGPAFASPSPAAEPADHGDAADHQGADSFDGAQHDEQGEHESGGVSVSDLLAAYGISGTGRRRRRG